MQNKTEQQVKDFVGEELPKTPLEAIDHCLLQLCADQTHSLADQVVPGMTFMDVIKALLMAQEWIGQDIQWAAEEENCR